jgi:hypothetical protein
MYILKAKDRCAILVVIFLAILIMGGCATKINYSYDPGMNFTGLKSYMWGSSSALVRQHSLVGSIVQFLADQVLQQKGFSKTSEKPDFIILIDYDYEIGIYRYSNQIRMLTLSIYRIENKDLIWRGTASGTFNTNTESSDLENVVQRILSKFPPTDSSKSLHEEKSSSPKVSPP